MSLLLLLSFALAVAIIALVQFVRFVVFLFDDEVPRE